MSNALSPILAAKAEHVEACKSRRNLSEIEQMAGEMPPPRGFARALAESAAAGKFPLIAEMKRKSPSGGDIRPGFDPASVARDYERAGAACLSILTDTPFFGGLDDDLARARAAVTLPALRKDFMIDPYQIAESRALGADCVLLIAAALDDGRLRGLAADAARFGMDALVEVHDAEELERALGMDATLIGINNRDLKTLKTDLATFELLAPTVPGDRLLVAESGLKVNKDLVRMRNSGARGYLVGESLLRSPDIVDATRRLLGHEESRIRLPIK